jgi:hypothetical protein
MILPEFFVLFYAFILSNSSGGFQKNGIQVMLNSYGTACWYRNGCYGPRYGPHILEAGYPLIVYNRCREKAEGLIGKGERREDSPGEAASKAVEAAVAWGRPASMRITFE